MYKFNLTNDTNFDFYLTKDEKEYKRDYSVYKVIDVDVTKSLYSTGGTQQTSDVKMNSILLTGLDNGYLTDSIPQQYFGQVVANNYYSYTLSGDQNWAGIGNNQNYDYTGFTGDKDLLIEFKSSIIQYDSDLLFLELYDTNEGFYGYFVLTYEDGLLNRYYIYDDNGTINDLISSGDTISFYLSNNTLYTQINGHTIRTNTNLNPSNDYRYVCQAFSAVSGVTYTVNDFMIYYQKNLYTGTTNNITDLNPTLTGSTHSLSKTQFKFTPVNGFTSGFTYSILNKSITGGTKPYYKQLMGGFYQGFFKLHGYPVEYFKTRANKGWTVNTVAAITNFEPTGKTLNDLHPTYPISRGSGMLFYLGTRAENKYLYITGDTLTSDFGITNDQPNDFPTQTISQIYTELDSTLFDQTNLYSNGNHLLLNGEKYKGFYNIYDNHYYTGRTYNAGTPLTIDYNYNDIIGNAFGVFLYDGKIGYRSVYATDPCFTGATQDANNIGENTFSGYTNSCSDKFNVSKIITKKFTVEQVLSANDVIDLLNTNDRFLNITIVFERDVTYDNDCDLKYGKYKNGTLKIYINGALMFNYDKFTEIIPHELDTPTYLQEGVPFNISFGGGSQGLIDMYTLTGITNTPPTTRLIDKFFSYSFIGGVTEIQMYMTPLDPLEVKNEFNKIKDDYNLFPRTGGRFTYYKKFGY